MHKDILFIAFFFSEKHGVGAARARELAKFLESQGYSLTVLSMKNIKTKSYILIWLLKTLFAISMFKGSHIYVSAGPFFHLLPISLVCKLFKKKLIVDFRDPWSLNILTNYGEHELSNKLNKSWKFQISLLIERITYKSCKSFVVCTQGMKVAYQKLFNDSSKIVVIENGYSFNPTLFNKNTDNDYLQVICVGKFAEYGLGRAEEVLKKVAKLQEKKDIKLLFIGTNKSINEPLVTQLGLINISSFIPQIPYEEALNYIAQSNIGLVIIRNDYFEYGTKVFDYIGIGLPFISNATKGSNFHIRFNKFIYDESLTTTMFDDKDRTTSHRNHQFKKFINLFQ